MISRNYLRDYKAGEFLSRNWPKKYRLVAISDGVHHLEEKRHSAWFPIALITHIWEDIEKSLSKQRKRITKTIERLEDEIQL